MNAVTRTAFGCAVALVQAVTSAATEAAPKGLDECIAIAVARHPGLRSATASVQAGSARVHQAVSGYLPQITAIYSANRRKTSLGANGLNGGGQSQTFSFYNTGLDFTQVLYDFGQRLHSIESSQASVRALEADAAAERETIVLNVKQSYFNLLAAKRLLTVADDTVRQDQKHVDQAQGRYEVGLAAKFDVTQAQVQLANAELNHITARNNVALARQTLRTAMGLIEPVDFEIIDTFDVQPLHLSEADALARAYDRRPELLSLRAQAEAAQEQVASLQATYLPNLTTGGSYHWSGNQYPLQDTWNIGASVNVPVFSGGLTVAQVAEAKANLMKLQYDEEALRQNIALEVRQALLNLQQSAEAIRVAEKGLQQARENLELAEARYNTGVGSIIEVTDAQTSRTGAEASHVQALYTYTTSIAAVERATAQEVVSK